MPLNRSSSVCALIPHFECEEWLGAAIESLLAQTRPLDGIVVIDDCSPVPPVEVVRRFPSVSLFTASENVGPYRLVQQVIDDTRFDAYLFQDADDWSAPDRLELLLREAEATGAELVGSHEVRILLEDAEAQPYRYPLDVNAALVDRPSSFPLLHPTSLVSRDLIARLGGFATGLRFSGDAEFLRRAGHAARVVNVDRYLYFRRKRRGSLTTGPGTGLQSPARLQLRADLAVRAEANADRTRRGEPVDLSPYAVRQPVTLVHRQGPALAPGAQGPVFVIGGPRSGMSVLTWALGQHPGLHAVRDGRALVELAATVARSAGFLDAQTSTLRAAFAPAIEAAVGSAPGRRFVAAHPELAATAPGLVDLFPTARFIHVVRPVEDVAGSFHRSPTDDELFLTADLAVDHWLSTTRAAVQVERAFGAGAVLRVPYSDLLDRPEEAVRTCLAFLGERFEPGCVRPLVGLEDRPADGPTDVPDAARALSEALLHGDGVPAVAEPEALEDLRQALAFRSTAGPGLRRRSMADHLRALVVASAPETATVVVASKGDPALVELGGREGWHFPQVEGGLYAGYHPADGDDAVAALEALVAKGAEFFALPASGFWWLDHYASLTRWLADRGRLVAFQEDAGALWRLDSEAGFRLVKP